jgi:hypothetical protein
MSRHIWRAPPWFAAPSNRIRFLYEFGLDNPRVQVLRPRRAYRGGFALATDITPTGVPTRNIEIHFSPGSPELPHVFVDGPTESPHRYGDGSLCMWYPYDPPEARWRPSNGPAALLGHIAAHLIKEQWYRQTGEWPGDEVGHFDNS